LPRDPWVHAERGDLRTLQFVAEINPSLLHEPNDKGFDPFFLACREGHLDIVQWLVEEKGANVNAPGAGDVTPLAIANDRHGENSAISAYLRAQGARTTVADAATNSENTADASSAAAEIRSEL